MTIQEKVEDYLKKSEGNFSVGQHEYYARIALEEALKAFKDRNYGIGAVAILATDHEVKEFRERNAMISGLGVVDHAETRALLKLKSDALPDKIYPKNLNQWTASLKNGISVFGTLEPCPMCACTLTNSGAKVSVSTVRDGDMITEDKYVISNGAANTVAYSDAGTGGEIKDKFRIQPKIWQTIQNLHKLEFGILSTSDRELQQLSMDIFLETREEIDSQIGGQLALYSIERAKSLKI